MCANISQIVGVVYVFTEEEVGTLCYSYSRYKVFFFLSTAVKLTVVSISSCLQIIHWAVLICLEVDGGSSDEWI